MSIYLHISYTKSLLMKNLLETKRPGSIMIAAKSESFRTCTEVQESVPGAHSPDSHILGRGPIWASRFCLVFSVDLPAVSSFPEYFQMGSKTVLTFSTTPQKKNGIVSLFSGWDAVYRLFQACGWGEMETPNQLPLVRSLNPPCYLQPHIAQECSSHLVGRLCLQLPCFSSADMGCLWDTCHYTEIILGP